MSEIYTRAQDLFEIPGVLNSVMQTTSGGTGDPTEKFLLIRYEDGRLEIEGSFYIELGQSIGATDIVIDLSNKDLFPEIVAPPTVLNIWVENAGLKLGACQFNNTTQQFLFSTTSDILSLITSLRYYIRGTLVPQNVKSLTSYLWGDPANA